MKRFVFLITFVLPLNVWGYAFVDWSTDNPTPDTVYDSDGTTPLPNGALIEVWNDAGEDGPDAPNNVTNDVLIITTTIDYEWGPGKFYVASPNISPGTYRFFVRAYNRELRENSPYYNNSQVQVFNVQDAGIYAVDIESFSTTIPNPLYTAIELLAFNADYINGVVYITWRTGAEVNTAGFNILRDDGISKIKINSSVIPPSFKPEGSSYSLIDSSVVPGMRYLYYLEEIERDGNKKLYGPVSVDIPYPSYMNVQRDGDDYIVSINLPSPEISEKNGISVKIEGLETYRIYENLEIPVKTLHFGIPHSGYRISIIEERNEEIPVRKEIEQSCFKINPPNIPGIFNLEEKCVSPSSETGRDGFSPPSPVEIAGDYILRAQRVLKVNIYPVRFSKKSLKIYKSLKFRIDFNENEISISPPEKFLETIYKGLMNYEEAGSFRKISSKLTYLPYLGKYIKASCKGDGIFSFDKSYISNAIGNEIMMTSEGKNWGFYSDNEKVYTYLPSFKSYWTDENSVFIKSGNGARAKTIPSSPEGITEITSFDEILVFDDDHYLFPAIPVGDDGELWFMDYMFRGDKIFKFNIPYPVSGPAQLEISLFGYMDISGSSDFHHVKAYLNNYQVCDITWEGKKEFKKTCDITSSLISGENTLKLSVLSDGGISNDIILLDYVKFIYKREFKTSEGEIKFRINSDGDVRVCCFDREPFFFKIGNGIEGVIKDFSKEISDGKISIRAFLEPGEYIVTEKTRTCETELKNPEVSGGDLIIIGPEEFRETAETLIKRREREGLKVSFVYVDDLYDLYNYGRKDPSAIKSFIKNLMEEEPPSYILLLGDGSYDPRDIFKTGKKDYVPAKFLQTAYLDYHSPSDTWYSAVSGDDIVPDVAIGRIPAENDDELKGVIEKIILFEDLIDNSAMKISSLFVADSGDGGIFIENMKDLMGVFPSEWAKTFLSYADYNDKERFKSEITSAVNNGVVYFNYSGHGSFDSWSKSMFYTANDMFSLQNYQPFILLPQDCLNGYFVVPFSKSIGEAALINPSGGASGAWVSSGFTTPPPQLALMKAFYKAVFENGAKRLGDAVLFALGNMDGVGGWEDVVKTWVLLGDPSMRLSPIESSGFPDERDKPNGGGISINGPGSFFKTKGVFGCSIPKENGFLYLLIPILFLIIKRSYRVFPSQ